jgi:phytoene dehydrogenase-like protein
VLLQSIEETASGLGADGRTWSRLFGPSSRAFDRLSEDLLRPIQHVPRHPIRLVRFGVPAALPATVLARGFRTREGRALFGGVAAHAFARLDRPMSSSVGVALVTACHAYGWAVAAGGSRSITDALAADLREHGGTIETERRVDSMAELDGADALVFDLEPGGVVEIAGDALPRRVARAYRRYKHGPAAFKVDLAVEGGVPWTNEACRRAVTVHLGGDFDEIAAAERDVATGRMPARPFVLVAQQYLADPSRSAGDVHPVWAYAHVPAGWSGDETETVIDQIERFAPGTRERIVGRATRSPAQLHDYNANYIGGDIIAGANTPLQILIRPRPALDPYRAGPGLFICSAATPPGAGVHGMNGANAAASVLRSLRD